MWWKLPGYFERHAAHMRGAIEAAPIRQTPYPHIIADNVLLPSLVKSMLARWPEDKMIPEGSGELHRRWAYLTGAGTDMSADLGDYWHQLNTHFGSQLVDAVFQKFKSLCVEKCGPDVAPVTGQLVVYDCLDGFSQDEPHVHETDGNTWLCTFLVCLDDISETRGTRVYQETPEGLELHTDTGFEPGRVFAFFEAPNSWHGSTPSYLRMKGRRMLRCHITAA